MFQPQQVTAFPVEHMMSIVNFGRLPDASNHHIRVCVCLTPQFVFFIRVDSGVLLTVINAQESASTLSINQNAKNVARNQAAPSSRVSSTQDDPDNCFNKLQLHWKMLRDHRDTDLYWFFEDDPVSLSKNSDIITEWLLLLLVELNIPTPLSGVKWRGILYVGVTPPQSILLECRSQSSWFGAYGSLSRQRFCTSTSLSDRPRKLSSSSVTFFHASIFLKHQPFDKLRQRL